MSSLRTEGTSVYSASGAAEASAESATANSAQSAEFAEFAHYDRHGPIRSRVQRSALSLLLFLLFGECLYPLYSIVIEQERGRIGTLLIFTGALLIVGCLRLASWLHLMLSFMLIAGALYYLFGIHEGLHWFNGYSELWIHDLKEVLHSGRLNQVSAETRMLLLLCGWALLVVSVQMLAIGRQTILLFLSLAVIYLLTLEVVFDAHVFWNIVRAAGIGLLIQSLVFTMYLREEGYIHLRSPYLGHNIWKASASAAVLGLVLTAAALSCLLPIQHERPQPLQALMKTIQSWNAGERFASAKLSAASVSGYGRDDDVLGAPLELRREAYFTARSPMAAYWRGESKGVYTGRGWIQPIRHGDAEQVYSNEVPTPRLRDTMDSSREMKQTIIFKEPISGTRPLMSGGLPVQVERLFTKDLIGVSLNTRFDVDSDAIFIERVSLAEGIQGYELTVSQQPPAGNDLRYVQGEDPVQIVERYVQLPDSLPERVRTLSASLVQDADNRYDAAMAVAKYLKQHYSYSLNTSIPPANEDFVDRFLFVDRQGYCDHFSTAMVVLLRSSDIPARWVKGFAPGEQSKQDHSLYTVSYADAHAWVEVYFPGKGWITFDPTPGYEAGMTGLAVHQGQRDLPPWAANILQGILERAASVIAVMHRAAADLQASFTKEPVAWTAVLLGGGPAVWFVMRVLARGFRDMIAYRNLFLLWVLLTKPRYGFPDRSLLLNAADRVWRELYRLYGRKPEAMTAREYAGLLAAKQLRNFSQLEEFISNWEMIYYGGFRPDRTNSKNFLDICRKLALRRG
ncbi:transglutaminase-like domain-containing protein [Paenibacillus fonticola]|uniref:transglutaminase-like domain-containing protein n=1 Tax=Paenibacillus fonticola TaxID=379896 RepID=UPI000380BE65|nr:transglutaminase domain-containing protein [Paenibacillus fonticola]